jgi:CRISPR-associated protein Cmr1
MSDTYPQPASGVSDSLLSSAQTWCLKALTPIWTGDAERKGERLILTGLLGSLRWWFEVLVRGLGGSAYDSTEEGNLCPDPKVKNATEPLHHCVVCELFGCTGWARKFRFQAFDTNGNVQRDQIKKNQDLKLRFILLRPIRREEWALLELTLRLIADYGGIGGRTVFKPSDENSRANAQHHRDYGLVKFVGEAPSVEQIDRKTLEDYVRSSRWREVDHDDFAWPSLQNFWCVKGKYLARQNNNNSSFNKVIGRPEPKSQASGGDSWLAGRRPDRQRGVEAESKKVFSFKEPADARRTFGFVKPGTVSFDQMKQRMKQAWPDLKDTDFQTGEAILEALFKRETGHQR